MKYHIEFDIDFKRNAHKGLLIAVEGIDGSGKTTQAEKVAEFLQKQGKNVCVTKNPTNSVVGKLIRQFLSGELHLPTVSFQYLFSADRQIQQQEEIIPCLTKGQSVITDRYFWSAVAYGIVDRMGEKENNGKLILVAHGILSMYHQFILPDYTFYLDISIESAMKRLSHMHKEVEVYEKKEKLERIREGYQWLIKTFPKEIIVIDGEKPVEEVTKEIINKLHKL